MNKPEKNTTSDLKGTVKITIDAVKGVTNIVESLHSTIASFTGIVGDPKKNANGISGMIYRNIRKITDAFGDGIDVMLNKLNHVLGDTPSLPGRESIIAATNGVIGDYLYQNDNPLAIKMSLRRDGIALTKDEIIRLSYEANGKIIFLVHGLCMNDLNWQRSEHNHGKRLESERGYTALYLHYNTGKHISENGKELALLLEQLALPNISLKIIAHSMGGLLIRSACFYAQKEQYQWLNQCEKIIFLGTPHHGALLEKSGNWLNTVLKISPYTEPFTKITHIRSSGITDLRYGNIIDEDWQDHDRFAHNTDKRTHVPLPNKIQHFAIASTTTENHDSLLASNVVGDGLVTINSALGVHKNLDLNIPENHKWIGGNINHNQLLENETVYQQIKKWLS